MIFPPSVIMILGGLLLPLLPKPLRSTAVIAIPALTLLHIWNIPPQAELTVEYLGFDIQPLKTHDFTLIFATAFGIAAFAGGLFAVKHASTTELSAAYIYAGSAIGATFSGDYLTLFVYWEIMAIASTIVVLCGNSGKARSAALRYAAMHFFGGAIFLAGITAHYIYAETLIIEPFAGISWAGLTEISLSEISLGDIGVLGILIGILVNAAAPPFSAWLADAYPESSPTGAVFLSAFTTKTAVFVLLTLFSGSSILITIGLFMVFYGIIYAMLENDMRRILSYSIVNQVGFMVTGVGIGGEMASFGVAAHAFCHIIYKALLLMSAGSVLLMTGRRKCSELGGLYNSMYLTTICGIIGALAISAFPWTSGFVSKSMISSAAGEAHLAITWFLLAAASAGVFLHAGIKFPWFVFFQKDSGLRPKDPPANMRLAMVFMSVLCIAPAVFPNELLYNMLPAENGYQPYTAEHVISQLQLLLFAGLAFFVFVQFTGMLKRTETISLDMDWIYRVFLRKVFVAIWDILANVGISITGSITATLRKCERNIFNLHGTTAPLGRNWAISQTVLYTAALLGVFLIVYFFGR